MRHGDLFRSFPQRYPTPVIQAEGTDDSFWPPAGKCKVGSAVYDTIADAVAVATSGQTIYVGPGTFDCNDVDLPVNVSMVGAGKESTILNGPSSTTYVLGLLSGTSCIVADLKIVNPRTTGNIFGINGGFSGSSGVTRGLISNVVVECNGALGGSHNIQGIALVNGDYILDNVEVNATPIIPSGTMYGLAGYNASGGTCTIKVLGGQLRAGWGSDVYGLNSNVIVTFVSTFLVNATIGGSPIVHGTYVADGGESFVALDSIETAAGATIDEFSTDGTLADDSDTALPTEKAVKTYVDGLLYDVPRCFAYSNAAQTLTTATLTSLSLNQETEDNASMHSTSVNNSRITAPVDGLYLCIGTIGYQISAIGERRTYIKKNGTTRYGDQFIGAPSVRPVMNTVAVIPLSAGDYVELEAYQTSGGNLDTYINGFTVSLSVTLFSRT